MVDLFDYSAIKFDFTQRGQYRKEYPHSEEGWTLNNSLLVYD